MTRDPLLGSPASPATLNAFGYGGGNPLTMSDPSGLAIERDGSDETGVVPPQDAPLPVACKYQFCMDPFTGGGGRGVVNPSETRIETAKNAQTIQSRQVAFTDDSQALVQLAKVARRTGVSREEANTLLEWARETGVRFQTIRTHPNRNFNVPHIHIGPIDHIRVLD